MPWSCCTSQRCSVSYWSAVYARNVSGYGAVSQLELSSVYQWLARLPIFVALWVNLWYFVLRMRRVRYALLFAFYNVLYFVHALNVRLLFIIIQCLSVIWQCLVNSDWLAMADLLLYLRYWYTKFCRKIVASLYSQLSLLSNVSCLYLKGGGMWGSLLPEGAYLLIA